MENIQGSITALITPFKNGKVDLEKYESLIKRQIANGVDAVSPVGTTGESATLSHQEHKECIEVAVATCKNTNVKVLAGAGSNATSEACDIAKFAQSVGADAILSIAPYYNKPTQEGLYIHYKTIAQSIELPFMLYNVPGRTGVDLLPQTAIRLYDDVKNIFAIKEATGSLDRATSIISQREDFMVFSGDDSVDFPMLASGAKGIVSVTSNLVPDLKSKIVNSIFEDDYKTALKIHNDLFELNQALFCESNPIPIKAAMYLAGLLDTLEFRLPLTSPSKETITKLENLLKKYEVKK
ncbi:4-hydroxy-tetrahydrodipicolinate synthase [Arcobacter porcinus]|uniref:4-hydroxy-tetrahydrodipicolinate synthase n=1 Tax=Arcobacter porcinus TaxID=1935204 RepID=A0A1C0AV67_9BACT|nr:4-hydroxy-tetrahydrodipicolinate synthase [Arcobacter porcinus]OCL94256.1 4-hydroxy-tetrahydrodipicolinate synthase [Aliarcobacter thereius]OCL81958.1 4-hydroxy-tetrahydrodipicolinate synthase [Arcobacter porcinus]OCL82034.1 4-hydroxy-tetrahydrodipicolinate synthase [Arcobacter porcinus]OCL86195.1 4-hydroxy-tetrahydrodipicolinate synthase [Arcobacter porcinus]OCL90334.1 4-hydroxy-tetrahydrodipicolinate synthase [Arcobacter porcinus]